MARIIEVTRTSLGRWMIGATNEQHPIVIDYINLANDEEFMELRRIINDAFRRQMADDPDGPEAAPERQVGEEAIVPAHLVAACRNLTECLYRRCGAAQEFEGALLEVVRESLKTGHARFRAEMGWS